jgi:UDP-3-O-[3-hydroxymyristoyl] glucosamine N-acyltransferase
MKFSATQIAQIINGKIEGNPESAVDSFGKIEEAKAGQLAFLANPKYEEYLYTTSASVIIINETLELKQPVTATLIRVSDSYAAFAGLLDAYQQMKAGMLSGIQEPMYMHASVKTGNNVFIGAFACLNENVVLGDGAKIHSGAYLGNNVTVGQNTVINAGVKIYHDCVIGSNVIIHAGTVIGSDGFGFAPMPDGTLKKVPQIGNVVIEDNVEIGANSTVDRATIGSTIIRKGVKIDNLVQIAHNVEVGSNTVIAAFAGISGSTKIGKNVMIGGQAGFAGHISVADGTKITGKSGITKTVKKPNTVLDGNPAIDLTTSLKHKALVKNLPQLEKRIKELEDLVKRLSNNQ